MYTYLPDNPVNQSLKIVNKNNEATRLWHWHEKAHRDTTLIEMTLAI